MPTDFTIQGAGVDLAGEESGAGAPVLLLHGLTATRRYVVMGSQALERSHHRVVKYDARGHGHSSPAPRTADYTYARLGDDAIAVLDALGLQRAVLAGASMGAHTSLNVALRHPDRVAGLVVITPAYCGERSLNEASLARWDRLADALRSGGIDGFAQAYELTTTLAAAYAQTVSTVIRQRLSQHDDLDALADALGAIPRSRPFGALDELAHIGVPAVVVASDDDADPEHPRAVALAYADAIPGARIVTDPPGSAPIAWQGSKLSQIIAEVVAESGLS